MEVTHKTNAIILNREPFLENDSRVFVYTQDFGKLELVVRGTRKLSSKLAGHIEPLNLCEIMIVKGKQYDYLGNAISKQVFREIKSDWDKINVVGWAVRVFNDLIKERQKDERIFNLLWWFLYVQNTMNVAESTGLPRSDITLGAIRPRNDRKQHRIATPPRNDMVSSLFIVQLLTLLGYKPEVYNCVKCKQKLKPENNKFNYRKGGVVCEKCQSGAGNEQVNITAEAIKVLRLALEKNLKFLAKVRLGDGFVMELENLVKGFVGYRY